MTSKIDKIKELRAMLDQNLITQAEFDTLKAELLAMPAMGSTSRPFSIPTSPARDRIAFRNPQTGEIIELRKGSVFWLTLLSGCFYLAYKEAWLHAGIAALLAIFTSGLSWLVYPFFAYRIIVDSYRRKGWIEIVMPPPLPARSSLPNLAGPPAQSVQTGRSDS